MYSVIHVWHKFAKIADEQNIPREAYLKYEETEVVVPFVLITD